MKTTRRIFLFLLPLFLIVVSFASVLQQRFCLKKRMMQTEEELFKEGETVEGVLADLRREVGNVNEMVGILLEPQHCSRRDIQHPA